MITIVSWLVVVAIGIGVGVVLLGNIVSIRKELQEMNRQNRDKEILSKRNAGHSDMIEKELSELTSLMKDNYLHEKDRELMEYTKASKMRQPVNNAVFTPREDSRVHQKNLESGRMLIPENLTEEERQILKDFYNL